MQAKSGDSWFGAKIGGAPSAQGFGAPEQRAPTYYNASTPDRLAPSLLERTGSRPWTLLGLGFVGDASVVGVVSVVSVVAVVARCIARRGSVELPLHARPF